VTLRVLRGVFSLPRDGRKGRIPATIILEDGEAAATAVNFAVY